LGENSLRLLLVDDHSLFRAGLKALLQSIDKFNEIIEVNCGASAIAFLEGDDNIDVVLLDYELGDISGLDVLTHIKGENPEIPIIMLSAHEDSLLIQQLLNKGASGFITKTSSTDIILSAINLVLLGGIYVPPAVLLGQINTQDNPAQPPVTIKNQPITLSSFVAPDTVKKDYQLTERQTDILRELVKGLSNKEIARVLDISPSTVKIHVAAVLKKLGAKNRTVAVTISSDMGLFVN